MPLRLRLQLQLQVRCPTRLPLTQHHARRQHTMAQKPASATRALFGADAAPASPCSCSCTCSCTCTCTCTCACTPHRHRPLADAQVTGLTIIMYMAATDLHHHHQHHGQHDHHDHERVQEPPSTGSRWQAMTVRASASAGPMTSRRMHTRSPPFQNAQLARETHARRLHTPAHQPCLPAGQGMRD